MRVASSGSIIFVLEGRLIPNRIQKVLSTMAAHRVRALLMGGQACVFYGAAEFSRDTDRLILADVLRLWPQDAKRMVAERSLFGLAEAGHISQLREALSSEERAEREKDRLYWEPLKAELEELR